MSYGRAKGCQDPSSHPVGAVRDGVAVRADWAIICYVVIPAVQLSCQRLEFT